MEPPSDEVKEQFIGSSIFCHTKLRFIRYHQLFYGKIEAPFKIVTQSSCFQKNIGNESDFTKMF